MMPEYQSYNQIQTNYPKYCVIFGPFFQIKITNT